MKSHMCLFGLQSSGASLVAFFLAQRAGATAIVDLYNERMIPDGVIRQKGPFLVKATCPPINGPQYLQSIRRAIGAEYTYLVLRNPWCAFASNLVRRPSAKILEKFHTMDSTLQRFDLYDAILCYEDLVLTPQRVREAVSHWPLPSNASCFPRSFREILAETLRRGDWAARKKRRGLMGTGNVHGIRAGRVSLTPSLLPRHVSRSQHTEVLQAAPCMCRWYEENRPDYIRLATISD